MIGQQAASLQLAQLKAYLALTQMNNAFAVGSRAPTLTANSSKPAPYIPATPPSPTATAISLLNFLKIVNNMSHPLYNPYATGNQSSTQGQYGLSSMQPERDPRRTSPHLGLASNFNTSGAPSSSSTNAAGKIPPLMSQSVTYRPEKSRAIMDDDIERSIDLHISRAREEVKFLGKVTHQPISQGSRFSSAQRDEFFSSGAGLTTYPLSSTSGPLGHRHTVTESGSSSLDWLPNYKKSTAEDSSKFYSSASSMHASSSDGRFNSSSEREHNKSIPGLGESDYSNKPVVTESSRPKYTSESAANILLHFGLEKEDLEHLISYPEDQITPANLPFILRQIRIHKAKRGTTGVQSLSEPQHTGSASGMDRLSSSGMSGILQEEMSSAVLQPSKVIDYGHTGKYTGGGDDDNGKTSGSRPNSSGSGNTLPMGSYETSHSQELKNKPTEVRSSALDSSRDQGSSIIRSSYRTETGNKEARSVAPTSSDPTERLQNQQIKQAQTSHSSFSLPKKDTDLRVHKSEASKNLSSQKLDAVCKSSSKTPSCTLFRDVHPSRPGLVVIGSSEASGTKDNKNKRQDSTTAEKKTQQQQQEQQRQEPQAQVQPLVKIKKGFWPPILPKAKPMPVPPVSLNPTVPHASHAMARSVFIPNAPPIVTPTAPPQPVQALFSRTPMQTLTPTPLSSRQPPAKVAVSKCLPTLAMMHDYAAATPRVFPHTCSLCNKECARMKVSGRLHPVVSLSRYIVDGLLLCLNIYKCKSFCLNFIKYKYYTISDQCNRMAP